MRYLFGFLCVCTLGLGPQSASAQAGEEGLTSDVGDSQPQTVGEYTLEDTELRVRRAKIGLWSTAGATVVGGVMMGASWTCMRGETLENACWGPFLTGAVVGFSGAVGMIVTGALLGARKRKLGEFDEAQHGRSHRVRWDLERSRFVF